MPGGACALAADHARADWTHGCTRAIEKRAFSGLDSALNDLAASAIGMVRVRSEDDAEAAHGVELGKSRGQGKSASADRAQRAPRRILNAKHSAHQHLRGGISGG